MGKKKGKVYAKDNTQVYTTYIDMKKWAKNI